MREGIEFRDVGFRYADNDEWALRGINLIIRPGEKLALVGHNGAGKTTLIKLLSRLYDPTEGSILIDGIDLREIDPLALRQKIGVIFQDFVRYHVPAKENIGFGQIDAMADLARVIESARKSGADTIIDGLPENYDTMLGRWFHGGHELSVGPVAEDRFGAGVHARRRDPRARRADGVGGRPIRVRDLSPLSGVDGGEDGDPDLAIAFRRCAWPIASRSSKAARSARSAAIKSWSIATAPTPACSACRRKAIAKPAVFNEFLRYSPSICDC